MATHAVTDATFDTEVRNADLPADMDVTGWLTRDLTARGEADAVAFLTSRNVERFTQAQAQVGGVIVHALATVGLSNGERVGARVDYSGRDWGTINVALHISDGLTEAALAQSLAAEFEKALDIHLTPLSFTEAELAHARGRAEHFTSEAFVRRR